MIQIIDSIMGSGKTTWAINYMNSHPDERFIYVTPFLSEVGRVKEACASIGMTEPSKDAWNKTYSIKQLIYDNCNVATTHAMLARIAVDDEFREHLQLNHYHLVLDETIEVLSEVNNLKPGDVNLILRNLATVDEKTGAVTWTDTSNEVIERYADIRAMAEAGTLVLMMNKMFMWLMPIKFIQAIPNITVLTFMFDGSHFSYYLKGHGLEYEYKHVDNGCLADGMQDLTEAKRQLREKLHIYEGPLNDIGAGQYALSVSWWKNHQKNTKKLADNVYNYFRNMRNVKSGKAGWSAFKTPKLAINGYAKSFLPFNEKATNKYADKNTAAYLVNVFEHPSVTEWFSSDRGGNVTTNQDQYALSTMLQWIWRFAIRKGEDTYLYIPSERMRTLLNNWLTINGDC